MVKISYDAYGFNLVLGCPFVYFCIVFVNLTDQKTSRGSDKHSRHSKSPRNSRLHTISVKSDDADSNRKDDRRQRKDDHGKADTERDRKRSEKQNQDENLKDRRLLTEILPRRRKYHLNTLTEYRKLNYTTFITLLLINSKGDNDVSNSLKLNDVSH